MSKNLFGNLLENEGMFRASTIVEDLSLKVPQRGPFFCSSPTMSWGSAVGYLPGMMELLYGPKSSGKTMIVLDRIKHAQMSEPDAIQIFVDAEMNFEYESTIRWMIANGVDVNKVLIIRNTYMKDIFEKKILGQIQKELYSKNVKINYMAIDSVQALSPMDIPITDKQIDQVDKKGGLTKQDYGARANYFSRIFPPFRMFCRDYRIFVTFIGQARDGGKDFHDNQLWTTNGGEALFHEVQYRTQVSPWGEPIFNESIKDAKGNPVKVGHRIKFVFEKNKAGEGMDRFGFCDIEYMKGIVNIENELIVLASKLGIINQSGAWLDFDGQRFQGIKKMAEALKDNRNMFEVIFSKVMSLASTQNATLILNPNVDIETGEILNAK
jgi:RecA/RadA recombinase